MLNDSKERLVHLFSRHYDQTATPAEHDELFKLIEQYDDQTLDSLIADAWSRLANVDHVIKPEKSEEIRQLILTGKTAEPDFGQSNFNKAVFNLKKLAAIAASVLIAVFIGYYFSVRQPQKNALVLHKNNPKPVHDALPGGNKAYLTLASGQKIVLDAMKTGVVAVQGNALVHKENSGLVSYKGVADKTGQPEINKLTTPSGGQYQLVLADGTKVWLNAETTLKFPVAFQEKERVVELDGEAYFEVAKDAHKPFLVKSGQAAIRVLGTHFNVMAYRNESVHKTTLVEGSVRIANGAENYTIKPGQQVEDIDNHLKAPVFIDTEREIAWKNGFFDFHKTSLEYIMRQASRWYGIDVKYTGKASLGVYTGRISRNVKISQLLNMLHYTGLSYQIMDKTVVIQE